MHINVQTKPSEFADLKRVGGQQPAFKSTKSQAASYWHDSYKNCGVLDYFISTLFLLEISNTAA